MKTRPIVFALMMVLTAPALAYPADDSRPPVQTARSAHEQGGDQSITGAIWRSMGNLNWPSGSSRKQKNVAQKSNDPEASHPPNLTFREPREAREASHPLGSLFQQMGNSVKEAEEARHFLGLLILIGGAVAIGAAANGW